MLLALLPDWGEVLCAWSVFSICNACIPSWLGTSAASWEEVLPACKTALFAQG